MDTTPQSPRLQHANHVPENASPALSVSCQWHPDVNVLPVLPGQRQRSPPSPHRRPVPVQPHGHAGVLQSVVPLPVNGNRQHDGHWDDTPLPLEDIAAQDQQQDLQYIDVAYYDMAHYPPVPPADHDVVQQEYDYRGVNNDARVAQGVPAQVQAVALLVPLAAPEVGIFDYAAGQDEAGPDRAFLGEWSHQGPVPNDPAAEVLRQFASRYLHQPGSQVDMVRMEPGLAGRIRVVITIELADL